MSTTTAQAPSASGRRRRGRALAAALMSGALLLATPSAALADGSASPDASAATTGTTLTTSMDGSGIDTLNPFLSYYNASLNSFGLIYPSLTTLDAQGKAIPYLAKSWTTSSDGLTWTFTLQSGLKWSDGQPITAEDAAWTLNLIRTNEVAGTANGSLVSNFTSVKATDDTTLVITTKKPQANMLYISIPVSGIPIVPKHIWESHVSDLKDYKNTTFPIVGYGPWTLTNYVTDQYETFRANKDWSNGDEKAPNFDTLVIRNFKNSDAAIAALKSGQLDMTGASAVQFKALANQSNITEYQAAGDGWSAVEINAAAKTTKGESFGTSNPALADPAVRKAIHMAIDKQKLVTNQLQGNGVVGAGYLPPAWPQWFWTPSDSQKISFDLDGANKLLDQAGYTKGSDGIRVDPKTKKPLTLRLGIHADDSGDAATAALMKGWLADLGINLKIESMSFSMLNANLGKGDWDMLMDGWTTGPDPSYLLSIQTCGALPETPDEAGMTDSFFCNKEFDKLYAEQMTTLDATKRQAIIARMQEILYEGNSDIITYYANGLGVFRNDLVSGVPFGDKNSEGLYPAQNVFDLYRVAAPPASSSEASTKSSTGTIIGVVVGVVVVAGAVVGYVLLRRKTAGDRE